MLTRARDLLILFKASFSVQI